MAAKYQVQSVASPDAWTQLSLDHLAQSMAALLVLGTAGMALGTGIMAEQTRTLLMAIRQALIIAIGAIEDYLELQRSIVPRRKR